MIMKNIASISMLFCAISLCACSTCETDEDTSMDTAEEATEPATEDPPETTPEPSEPSSEETDDTANLDTGV